MPHLRLPENYVPTDGKLLSIILRTPLISLIELTAAVWPVLPWRPVAGGQISATTSTYAWAQPGNRTLNVTPAVYLLDRLENLILAGKVRRGPYRADLAKPGARQGGLTFILPVLVVVAAAGKEVVAHV